MVFYSGPYIKAAAKKEPQMTEQEPGCSIEKPETDKPDVAQKAQGTPQKTVPATSIHEAVLVAFGVRRRATKVFCGSLED